MVSWCDQRCQMTSSLSFGFEGPTPLLKSIQ